MTDPAAPDPSNSNEPEPPDRVRIDGPPPQRRMDALPLLYVLGFLVLAVSLFYLYRNPGVPENAAQEAARVDTLQQQLQSLGDRLAQVEQRPASENAPLEARVAAVEQRPVATSMPDMAPLEARIAAIEQRPAAPPPPNTAPIEARIAAIEQRPAPPSTAPLEARIAKLEQQAAVPPPPPVDLGPLTTRLDGLAAKQVADLSGLSTRLDALEGRVAAVETQGSATASQLGSVADRAQSATRLQLASAALNSGRKLGDIPGAPPALARFANEAPPTETTLRHSFEAAAEAAQRASQPAIMEEKPFAARLWTRAQQSVTVRQGERVLLGDPIAGVLTNARQAVEAGDLPAALSALDGLAGPAAAAMTGWTSQARALLEARAALASMAARG